MVRPARRIVKPPALVKSAPVALPFLLVVALLASLASAAPRALSQANPAQPNPAQANSAQPTSAAPVPLPWDQNPNGMRIYIWAGLKSHFSGQHDYPQFLADWSKLLTEHGAVVDGALHPPTADDLAHTDVLLLYKGDAGYMGETEKNLLVAYVRRGGGIVSLHDSLCGPDPAFFATLLGGAKKHGEVNYTLAAPIPYTLTDPASPILQGMSNLTLYDEAFYNITWAQPPDNPSPVVPSPVSPSPANPSPASKPSSNPLPSVPAVAAEVAPNQPATLHILATTVIPATPSAGAHKGEVVPQIWTWEHTLPSGQPARAFVWMQGHEYANFQNYQIQQMLLRAIAWTAHQPISELADYVPPTPPRTNAPAPAK